MRAECDTMEEMAMTAGGEHRRRWGVLAVLVVLAGLAPAGWSDAEAMGADLHAETIAAWDHYVALTEARIDTELALEDDERFLAQDFLEDAAEARRALLAGEVRIDRLQMRDAGGDRPDVPKGAIHHWLGRVLVPDVTIDQLMHAVMGAVPPHDLQPDVLESRILEQDGNSRRVFLRLRREAMFTVHYHTEHDVLFTRRGDDRWSSLSVATRIAELEDAETPDEREKPIGNDRGFLWRLNSYWRYQQVEEGVIVECESVSLSRSVPAMLRWMIGPIINRTARETLTATLTSMSDVLRERAPLQFPAAE